MKKNLLLVAGTILMLSNLNSTGQSDKKRDDHKRRIVLKVKDDKDGKEIMIDTTFDVKDQANVEKYLREKGYMEDAPTPPPAPPSPPSPLTASEHSNSSSNSYTFSMKTDGDDEKDENITLNFNSDDFNNAMADIGKVIEDAMKDSEMSKADIEKLKKEVDKEIKEIKSHQVIKEERIVKNKSGNKKSKEGKKEIHITITED